MTIKKTTKKYWFNVDEILYIQYYSNTDNSFKEGF